MNGRELISEEKGTSSGRGKCFPLDIERGQLSGPRTQSGLFATCNHDRRDGYPACSGLQETGGRHVFSGQPEGVIIRSKGFRYGSGRFYVLDMERVLFAGPQTQSIRAVCHKNHDRRDGFPAYSGLQETGDRIVFSGQPEMAGCRGFCGKQDDRAWNPALSNESGDL